MNRACGPQTGAHPGVEAVGVGLVFPSNAPDMAGLDAETFRKVLQLEVSRKFDDKAVGGGMDRFLEHWADDLPTLWGGKPPNGSYAVCPGPSARPGLRGGWRG